MLEIVNVKAFTAAIPVAVQVVLVPPNLNNLVVFDANFQSA